MEGRLETVNQEAYGYCFQSWGPSPRKKRVGLETWSFWKHMMKPLSGLVTLLSLLGGDSSKGNTTFPRLPTRSGLTVVVNTTEAAYGSHQCHQEYNV